MPFNGATVIFINILYLDIKETFLRPILDLHHQQLLEPDDDLHRVRAGTGHWPHQPPELPHIWGPELLAWSGGGATPLLCSVTLYLGHSKLSAEVTIQTRSVNVDNDITLMC